MWSGRDVVAEQCPLSTAGGFPAAWLEQFAMLTSGVVASSAEWWAKDMDAMTVLANEAQRLGELD